jgi:hypothetical protein
VSVWEDDANAGFDIVDSRHDNHDQDIAQGINNCLTKDGQNSPTADLSMNTFKHTNVGDGTARNHYATIGQLQDQAVQALSSVGGTADAITATTIPAISAYVTGARYTFKAISSNSGPTTLKIGTGSVLAVQWLGAALTGGEIAANAWHTVVYDGSLFQLLNPAMSASARTLPVSVAQLQDGSIIWCGTSGGSANAQTLTPSPAISAYAAGQVFRFVAGFTSTAALTLQVSGLAGPKTCLMKGSLAPFSSLAFLVAGLAYEALYDGTNFLITDVMDLGQYSNDAGAARIKLFKSRGVTAGTNTIVQSGDGLGQLDFYGANGTGFTRGAFINATVDGTPGASNDMPTALTFATTADGSGSPTERMRIDSSGNISIGTGTSGGRLTTQAVASGNAFAAVNSAGTSFFTLRDDGLVTSGNLTNSPYNFTTASAANVVVNASFQLQRSTSSLRYKTDVHDYTRGIDAVKALRPVFYKGINDGDKQFAGLIAEEVHDAGLSEFVVYNDEGQPDALQYSNMIALALKAIQELEARVDALEA